MKLQLKSKTLFITLLGGMAMLTLFLLPLPVLANSPVCSTPSLAIPDAGGGSSGREPGPVISDTLIMAGTGLITDLNVSISTTHAYVGDLVFTLTHKVDGSATSVFIIDQPLLGNSAVGIHEPACTGDNIDVILDDEASLDIQVNCEEGTTADDGTEAYTAGGFYRPANPLSIFDGDPIAGTWELSVNDNYAGDDGTLNQWCLIPKTTRPDLQISKTDSGGVARPGDPLTYTLTYVNGGAAAATGVVITETLPANTSFNPASPAAWQQDGTSNQYTYSVGFLDLGPGQTISFVVTLDEPLPDGVDSVTNTVEIGDDGANGNDMNPDDNQAEISTTVTFAPDLTITKDDGGITVMPGDSITYTITYANDGDAAATGVVITETLAANTSLNPATPAGWQQVGATKEYTYNVGNLDVGPGQTISFVVTITDSPPSGVDSITNMVKIGDDGTHGSDVNPDDNEAEIITIITFPQPDLHIDKTASGGAVSPGDPLTYTLTYSNSGTANASGVVITETLPDYTSFNPATPAGWQQVGASDQYTYSVGSLDVGPGQTISFVVTIDDPLPDGVDSITNTVEIEDDGGRSDIATAVTTIGSNNVYLPIVVKNN